MKYSEHIKPISYLKAHASDVARSLNELREPMVITQNGEAKMVVQDIRSYEQTQETLALLKILAMGNREVERDETIDAEDAFAAIQSRDDEH
ncbi:MULTISPECIES: type II toxin-antitoxin system Phd/YefM family antitoxin [Halomonadaceae]|uniref:Antitoxin n=1 Tax=Modicisalibacter zincidurans TaxID=1178777 RepID=A0ABP9RHI7_9GAMM|nr:MULTISPECIES: type II toxin-antitoxin system Phd/YefM family antitoxin [Halomonas]MCD6008542.1 type II toxin-antitoxin system Phd/YefM family antitoxin [Halomonas sp. IOP_31]